jgi:hypothetical protein
LRKSKNVFWWELRAERISNKKGMENHEHIRRKELKESIILGMMVYSRL